jgi:hypothetical protein
MSHCPRIFKTEHYYFQHLKEHTNPKERPTCKVLEPVNCQICGKLYATKRTLKRHLKVHERRQEREEKERGKVKGRNVVRLTSADFEL